MYSAFKEFYNLLSQVDSAYHDAALKLGLTDSELDILYSLNEHGSGCNQSIFYKETGTTKSTINSAVRRMEQAGYLYETRNRAEHLRFSHGKRRGTHEKYRPSPDRH